MRFQDYTILYGRIHSERRHYTEHLARPAVDACRELLDALRRGAMRLPHGVPALPPFAVELGFPDLAPDEATRERFAARGHWFSVYQTGQEKPFQVNLVLHDSADSDYEEYACMTLLGLSMAGEPVGDRYAEMEADMRRMREHRPMLATALLPFADDPEVVRVAADFSTCFAAAMLEEARDGG